MLGTGESSFVPCPNALSLVPVVSRWHFTWVTQLRPTSELAQSYFPAPLACTFAPPAPLSISIGNPLTASGTKRKLDGTTAETFTTKLSPGAMVPTLHVITLASPTGPVG